MTWSQHPLYDRSALKFEAHTTVQCIEQTTGCMKKERFCGGISKIDHNINPSYSHPHPHIHTKHWTKDKCERRAPNSTAFNKSSSIFMPNKIYTPFSFWVAIQNAMRPSLILFSSTLQTMFFFRFVSVVFSTEQPLTTTFNDMHVILIGWSFITYIKWGKSNWFGTIYSAERFW